MTPAALRELAEKATAGDWWSRNDGAVFVHAMPVAVAYAPCDGAYIAAAHPGVILEMLDALDRAEEALREFTSGKTAEIHARGEEIRAHADERRKRIRAGARLGSTKRFEL